MAYTSAPENQTYGTQRVGLAHPIDFPAGASSMDSKCAGMLNVLPFKQTVEGKELVVGQTRYAINASLVVAGGYCRGMYVWEKSPGLTYYFMAVYVASATETRMYTSTDGVVWANVNTIASGSTADGPVRFVEFISSTNIKSLVAVDGVNGYVYTSNAAGTQIVDADFPTPHLPFPVFLNGRLYLAKLNTGDIYNSALDDPSNWTAGDFISSEIYPDDLQALVKVNNYILAIGISGSEYFYDAANPTASPLARDQGATLPFGCQIPNTLAFNLDTLVFLANNNDGESVLKIVQGLNHKEIPCNFLFNALYLYVNDGYTTSRTIRAYLFRQQSKLFYALCFNGSSTANSLRAHNPTFIYSFETEMWSEVSVGEDGADAFPIYFTAPSRQGGYYTFIAGHAGAGAMFGKFIGAEEDGDIDRYPVGGIQMLENIYQELRTTPFSFGTMNRKTMLRLAVVYRMHDDIGFSTTLPWVSYDDSGGALGWGSDVRQLAGSPADSTNDRVGFPFLTQLGSFRQRAFKIYAVGGIRIWYYLEIDINKGQQ